VPSLSPSNLRKETTFNTALSLRPSNLRKETIFNTALSLRDLPFDADRQRHQRHWCLLGEITAIIPWPLRLCLHIRDMDNEQLLIAFYDNKRGETFAKNPELKPGRTMAFLYPQFHYFADGQTGLRIEQSAVQKGRVKILPYTMDTILKVNDKIWEEKDRCQKCQKEGVELKMCSRCQSAVYCGKVCLLCLDARIDSLACIVTNW
jgi:hypothetical protein